MASLCDVGWDVGEITDANLKCETLKKLFLSGSVAKAYWLKLKNGTNPKIVEFLSSMYHSVYGQKPNNGTISHEFFRAAMYTKARDLVNWAKHAKTLFSRRIANAIKNPWKLQPPCLASQVQGIINEVAATMQAIRLKSSQQSIGGPRSKISKLPSKLSPKHCKEV